MKINENIEQLVGDNVRGYRERLDISQEKLAEYAEVHRTFIGQIERAEKTITIRSLLKLAVALRIEPYQLLIKDSYK